jgi:xanthine dehydrogenase accessory factor
MDRDVIARLAAAAGEAALVTIIEVKGSAPRHPGSKMIVFPSGSIAGTIGGGRGETLAIEAGLAAIRDRASSILEVEMLGSDAEGKDLICGGVNRMLVEYVGEDAPYAAALAELDVGRRVVLGKRLSASGGGDAHVAVGIGVLSEEGEGLFPKTADESRSASAAKAASTGKALLLEDEGLFLDPLAPEEKLVIAGGGHVGLALVRAALPLGFSVSVIDSRQEYLAHGRFPEGVRTFHGSYADSIAAFPFDPSTYAVVVTPGHLYDLEACRAVLKRPFRYAGLIGSSRKIGLIREQLLKDGYPAELVEKLRAPIGLSIGAETPEEIAVSILAEIVACRRNVAPGRFAY